MITLLKKIGITILIFVGILILYIFSSRFFFENKTSHQDAPKEVLFKTLSNGDEMAYQEINNNSSTTIVFIGGLSGWSGTWIRTMEQLNRSNDIKKYNLLAIDLPPFGYTNVKLDGDVFFRDEQAKRINLFREALGLSKVIFVGHSYGAGVTSEAVIQNPQGVEKFIIIDGVLNVGDNKKVSTSLFTDQLSFSALALNSVIHIRPAIQNRLKTFVYQKQNIDGDLTKIYMQSFNVKGTSEKFALWLRDYIIDPQTYKSNIGAEYSKLKMPIRLIWGEQDSLTPISLGYELQKFIPNAKIYPLKNVGHIPMIEDHEQFDAALLNSITE